MKFSVPGSPWRHGEPGTENRLVDKKQFAYRIEPGWRLFAAAALTTLALVLLTVDAQASGAIARNLAEALKVE